MNDRFIYNGELYHFGVKGMKWGVRRRRDAKRAAYQAYKKSMYDSASKREKAILDKNATKSYRQRTKENRKQAIAGVAVKATAKALNGIGKAKYNSLNGVGSPGQVAVLRGLGYSSKILNAAGDAMVIGAAFKQRANRMDRKYRYGS